MVFIAFAFLRAVPVHKESHCEMDLDDRDQHDTGDAKDGDAAEQTDDQAESAKELREDGNYGEDGRDAELCGHEVDGAAETVAAEPSQGLLQAVDEEDDAKNQAADGER